jgi:phosphoglycolate phosphatase
MTPLVAAGSAPPGFRGLIEVAPGFAPRPQASHVLLDFDGTISLIRQGWPEVMVPMFLEFLPRRADETEEQVHALMLEDILRLNGKQTIYQMIQFAGRVAERGGAPREPLWYKHEYLRRLDARIQRRLDALCDGGLAPDTLLVFGARTLLEELVRRGFTLYLASGTDLAYVRAEARLLGVDHFFGPHIYGALDDYRQFSKQLVIERILAEQRITGEELLAFGDGYVEIQNTKAAGGLAVAVASDEANNGSGRMDPWKHQRLLGVGADLVVPDFRDAVPLLNLILGT